MNKTASPQKERTFFDAEKWKLFVSDNTAEQFSKQNQIFTFQTIMKTLKHFSEYFFEILNKFKTS